jgi:hypothetical protein
MDGLKNPNEREYEQPSYSVATLALRPADVGLVIPWPAG